MKTEFKLDVVSDRSFSGKIEIIGDKRIKHSEFATPYVRIGVSKYLNSEFMCATIKDRDLECFAVNILKALKSKKLKQ